MIVKNLRKQFKILEYNLKWGMEILNIHQQQFNKPYEVQKYQQMRPNLTEHEIQQIYQTFQMYEPRNGVIESSKVLEKYEKTGDCENLKMQFKKAIKKIINTYI